MLDALASEAGVALGQVRGARLGRNDKLWRAVLRAPAPVMLFDDAGRVLLLSRAWLNATGHASGEVRHIDEWSARACDGRSAAVADFLQQVIRDEGAGDTAEFSFEMKEGARRDWRLVASALGSLSARRGLYICLAEDVTERRAAEAQAREREHQHRTVLEALPAAVYTTDAEGRITYYNQAAADLWGRRPEPGSQWCGSWRLYWPDGRAMAHDDCPMATALKESRAIRGTEAVAERPDGRMVSFVPYPTPLYDSAGHLVGAVNMLVDITARKQAERRLGVLARELDHRTKNLLAVIQGVIHFTNGDNVRDFSLALEGRIMALARAHCLLSDNLWEGADLKYLVEQELAPYRREDETRVRIEGASLALGPAAAQSIAMMVHELASNAKKFGALRGERGRIDVSWVRTDPSSIELRWQESGGPATHPPSRRGFGISLIERTVASDKAGAAQFDWQKTGLICRLQIPTLERTLAS